MSIRYEKLDLSEAKLDRLRNEMEKTESPRKFGRFMAWTHYSRLKRYRDLGWHWCYLKGTDSFHCTCGLVLEQKEASKRPVLIEVPKPVKEMSESEASAFVDEVLVALVGEEVAIPGGQLDEVQRVIGHRNLPSGRGFAIALIIRCPLNESLHERCWDAICQSCAASLLQVSHKEASDFVRAHNKSCKRSHGRNKR